MISVSIVSHGHGEHVGALLDDLRELGRDDLEVLLTLNIEGDGEFASLAEAPRLRVLRNASPRGFAANHNAAFRAAIGEYFCVLNPDVRLPGDPFGTLLAVLDDERVGVAAPAVVGSDGGPQESYRRVPTPGVLLCKALGLGSGPGYAPAPRLYPDWLAGMFMLFPRRAFAEVGGFDERYYLYYEDVDICCRLWLAGYRVCVASDARAVHDGRYASRRNLRHLRWHLQSLWRFFRSPVYRRFSSQPRL